MAGNGWREMGGGKGLAGNGWRETDGGKRVAANGWREMGGGKGLCGIRQSFTKKPAIIRIKNIGTCTSRPTASLVGPLQAYRPTAGRLGLIWSPTAQSASSKLMGHQSACCGLTGLSWPVAGRRCIIFENSFFSVIFL